MWWQIVLIVILIIIIIPLLLLALFCFGLGLYMLPGSIAQLYYLSYQLVKILLVETKKTVKRYRKKRGKKNENKKAKVG